MDTALELKIDVDNGQIFSDRQIIDKLHKSELVIELTSDFPEKPLAILWRLICISEIPYSYKLDYTQKLIDIVYKKLATPFGFSLSGDEKMFLPCYNAMIVSALCRLDRAKDQQVRNAVEWINRNQPMQNGKKVEILFSKTGVDLVEGARYVSLLGNKKFEKQGNQFADILALFQMGPRTGNPLFGSAMTNDLHTKLLNICENQNLTSITMLRETNKYPVVSGEIIKVTGYCAPPKRLK